MVISCSYELAMSFSEGLACVAEHDKCGYINKAGELIIDYRFDAASPFEEGVARVKEAGKWQLIDSKGKLIKVF